MKIQPEVAAFVGKVDFDPDALFAKYGRAGFHCTDFWSEPVRLVRERRRRSYRHSCVAQVSNGDES